MQIPEDPPSPSGRGREARARQGEASRQCGGLKLRKDFSLGLALSGSHFARPSPGAPARRLSRRPLPEGEGLLPNSFTRSQRGGALWIIAALLAIGFLPSAAAQGPSYDLVIRNGRIVDGSGS